MRKKFIRSFGSFYLVDLCPANAAEMDFDMDLAVCELIWEFDITHLKWLVTFDKNGCFHKEPHILFEIDKFVVARIAEMTVEPYPFGCIEK